MSSYALIIEKRAGTILATDSCRYSPRISCCFRKSTRPPAFILSRRNSGIGTPREGCPFRPVLDGTRNNVYLQFIPQVDRLSSPRTFYDRQANIQGITVKNARNSSATIAFTPAAFREIGARSRLEPQPKFLPPQGSRREPSSEETQDRYPAYRSLPDPRLRRTRILGLKDVVRTDIVAILRQNKGPQDEFHVHPPYASSLGSVSSPVRAVVAAVAADPR